MHIVIDPYSSPEGAYQAQRFLACKRRLITTQVARENESTTTCLAPAPCSARGSRRAMPLLFVYICDLVYSGCAALAHAVRCNSKLLLLCVAQHSRVVLQRDQVVLGNARHGGGREIQHVFQAAHTNLDERVDHRAPFGFAGVGQPS